MGIVPKAVGTTAENFTSTLCERRKEKVKLAVYCSSSFESGYEFYLIPSKSSIANFIFIIISVNKILTVCEYKC